MCIRYVNMHMAESTRSMIEWKIRRGNRLSYLHPGKDGVGVGINNVTVTVTVTVIYY